MNERSELAEKVDREVTPYIPDHLLPQFNDWVNEIDHELDIITRHYTFSDGTVNVEEVLMNFAISMRGFFRNTVNGDAAYFTRMLLHVPATISNWMLLSLHQTHDQRQFDNQWHRFERWWSELQVNYLHLSATLKMLPRDKTSAADIKAILAVLGEDL